MGSPEKNHIFVANYKQKYLHSPLTRKTQNTNNALPNRNGVTVSHEVENIELCECIFRILLLGILVLETGIMLVNVHKRGGDGYTL